MERPTNAAVRRATCPPRGPVGPFRVIGAGHGVTASPEGGYEVRVLVAPLRGPIGGVKIRPCCVIFWYASGYEGGPATVVFQANPGDGAFDLGRAVMYFGANTDVRHAPPAIHNPDGSLSRKDGG